MQLLTGSSPTRNNAGTPSQTLSHPFPTTPSSSKSTGWATRKRGRPFEADDASKRRRTGSYSVRQSGDKGHNKGLRHFSQRVCEKVCQKGNTTYNEVFKLLGAGFIFPLLCIIVQVADELVKELSESERKSHGSVDVVSVDVLVMRDIQESS